MISCVVTSFLYITIDKSWPDGQNNKYSFSISGATCFAMPHTSFGVDRPKVLRRRLANSCRDSPLLKPSASGKLPPLLLMNILQKQPSHMLLMVCAPPAKVDAAAHIRVPVIASTLPVGLGTNIIAAAYLATCQFSQVCQYTKLQVYKSTIVDVQT